MSDSCTMCGSSIPAGQGVCSMCYGDIDFGSDGYYREWAEKQAQEKQREEEPEPPENIIIRNNRESRGF